MTHINYLMENRKKRYELHNDKNNSYFIFIINYNEMHFPIPIYMGILDKIRWSLFFQRFLRIRFFDIEVRPHIRGGDKKK
ncbi:hypothetical protein ACJX0J_002503, partial [Zea mays]